MATYKNPNDPENVVIKQKIRDWLHEIHHVATSDILSIEEIPCWEPRCPDVFTKISLKESSGYQDVVIRKPLVFVRKVDVMGATMPRRSH